MAEPDAVAKRLIEANWQQGDLLSPLSLTVAFDPNHPYSKAAKAATHTELQKNVNCVPHSVATRPMSASRRLVLASQTCDIVRNLELEQNVVALEAFYTTNERVIAEARGNSPRYFLLDPQQGLVVDARGIAVIEKPLLASLERLPQPPNTGARARLARWLARRFNRPALPDDVVAHVGRPITNGLTALRETDTEARRILSQVSDVRIATLHGTPPYHVRLLFIVDGDAFDRQTIVTGLARIVTDMSTWLDENARIVAWDSADLFEISAGDYLNTVPLYAEHLTEQGGQAQEILSPQYGYEDFS